MNVNGVTTSGIQGRRRNQRFAQSVKALIGIKKRRMVYEKTKLRARRAVSHAIKSGTLVRKPCEVCKATKVDGHHDDYKKPLSVRWLCKQHHSDVHSGISSTKDKMMSKSLSWDIESEIKILNIESKLKYRVSQSAIIRRVIKMTPFDKIVEQLNRELNRQLGE